MPRYELRKPSQPRHIVSFSRKELFEALIDYAKKKNIPLPKGQQTIWGLDTKLDTSMDHHIVITIAIDEEEK